MSIPSYDFLEKPYDDDILTYDYDENRYIPLVKGIKANAYVSLEREWGNENNAQCYLDLVGRVVYEVILSRKDQKYRNKTLYYLSHSKEAREILIKIFTDSVWYNRRDGGFMMAYNSGANLNQGKLIEFGIDKACSSIAKQLIKNTILGTRIFSIDINKATKYVALDDLLSFLVENEYITQNESDVVALSEDLEDLPYHEDYSVTLLDSGEYLFRDLKTLQKAIINMKKYNGIGDW